MVHVEPHARSSVHAFHEYDRDVFVRRYPVVGRHFGR
jgi:hypothetical protein